MKTAQEHFEKAVREFVYPVEQATQEDIDWIVTPLLEALKDWLTEHRDAFENKSHKVEKPEDIVIVAGIYRLAATTCNGLLNQVQTSDNKLTSESK